jgi:hypothetical protein
MGHQQLAIDEHVVNLDTLVSECEGVLQRTLIAIVVVSVGGKERGR